MTTFAHHGEGGCQGVPQPAKQGFQNKGSPSQDDNLASLCETSKGIGFAWGPREFWWTHIWDDAKQGC